MDCVFCRIRDGQLPAFKVYDDDQAFAIMDIAPLNPGHVLVITREHAPTIAEVSEESIRAAAAAARRVGAALLAALGADGLSVVQANGPAAFQSVHHFHFHLIPRWEGDNKLPNWEAAPGDRAELARLAGQIRDAIA